MLSRTVTLTVLIFCILCSSSGALMRCVVYQLPFALVFAVERSFCFLELESPLPAPRTRYGPRFHLYLSCDYSLQHTQVGRLWSASLPPVGRTLLII